MMQIVKYSTEEEKQQIIEEKTNEGLVLIEIANITEGNFLGFMDTCPIQVDSTPEVLLGIRNNTDLILLKQEGII